MTSIYDLSLDLIEEILSRVSMTSQGAIRSTCKFWKTLSEDPSFKLCGKAAKDIMLITLHDFKPCLMSVNLHNHQDLVDPFIKQIGKFKQGVVDINILFYCNGLLLCVAGEHKFLRLVVWNPYTGQTRWIQPYCVSSLYGMGYDSNNRHKILRIPYVWADKSTGYEIYDFKTKSWRVLDVSIIWHIYSTGEGVSLKGNNYFIARSGVGEEALLRNRLLCFDFTQERFWNVPLPFSSSREDSVILSSVGEEKLAVLYRRCDASEMEIWITNRIDEPNLVSWSCFLKVDKLPIDRFQYLYGSFFLDEKKKVAVIYCINLTTDDRHNACMVGEGGHYREVDLGETFKYNADMRNKELDTADKRKLQRIYGPYICSSYVPSCVQIQ